MVRCATWRDDPNGDLLPWLSIGRRGPSRASVPVRRGRRSADAAATGSQGHAVFSRADGFSHGWSCDDLVHVNGGKLRARMGRPLFDQVPIC